MTTPSSNDRLSLGFVGDICLSLGVIDVVRSHGGAFLFDGIRHLYDRFDLTTGNLECCIVNDESWSNSGWPPLDIPVDVANALLRSNIGVFCLANNHVLDRDAQGLSSTLDFLNRSGLSHFGAGHDIEAAEALLTVEVKGRRIAFIGAADMTAYHASRSGPGIAPLNARRLDRRIRAARRVADLVVVALHADLEFVSHPAPYRRRVSRRLTKSTVNNSNSLQLLQIMC